VNTTLVASIISASVPSLLVVLSIVLSRADYHKLDNKIDALDSKLDAKIDAVRAQQHADMLRIYELFGEHSQRIARLETLVQGR
jgi:uncharacterized protein with PIN domain